MSQNHVDRLLDQWEESRERGVHISPKNSVANFRNVLTKFEMRFISL